MISEVRPISAAETRPLRQKILRPHQSVEDLVFPGDDSGDGRHFGIYDDGALIGTVSMYREAHPQFPGEDVWRFRGMAVEEAYRRQGLGGLLVKQCIETARAEGGQVLWCNARTGAASFYERLGLEKDGDEFDLPGIGPHYLMHIAL